MFAKFASAYIVLHEPFWRRLSIFKFYEKRGFEPSRAEREVLLNL